jgi:hypothetical protein
MNPALKNWLELFFSGMFVLATVVWPAQALSGEKDWWPYGVIGLVAMLYWITVFAKRWQKI